jgi:hypothetical protein
MDPVLSVPLLFCSVIYAAKTTVKIEAVFGAPRVTPSNRALIGFLSRNPSTVWHLLYSAPHTPLSLQTITIMQVNPKIRKEIQAI